MECRQMLQPSRIVAQFCQFIIKNVLLFMAQSKNKVLHLTMKKKLDIPFATDNSWFDLFSKEITSFQNLFFETFACKLLKKQHFCCSKFAHMSENV